MKHCLAVEKQSNADLTEAVRRQRRAAAKQGAEAAGREHKHQEEVQELRKVCSHQSHALKALLVRLQTTLNSTLVIPLKCLIGVKILVF